MRHYEAISTVNDLVSLIGITVRDVIVRFGPPSAVYPLRGDVEWQDDVVFEYTGVDFYIFKDSVWQISIKSANGIRIGDAKMAISLVHGTAIEDKGSHVIAPVLNRSWRVNYRYEIERGKVAAIYLYRPDF
ncbi:MAG: hypothetical protein LBD22_03515 [Spirochaetaceae bacterium]|nr:hypothetical protein [Spirochaetaceae bacterium]